MDTLRLDIEETDGTAVTLTKAVRQISEYIGIDPEEFMSYVQQDKLKGYPDTVAGSIWTSEGRILYALVMSKCLTDIIEIGTWAGASTAHLCAAASKISGKVVSVDTWQRTAELVPDEYRSCLELVTSMGHDYVAKFHNSIDLIFEDTDHTYKTAYQIAMEGKRALKPGGFYVTHDVYAPDQNAGKMLRKALHDADMEGINILIKPSNSGIGIWRKPNA